MVTDHCQLRTSGDLGTNSLAPTSLLPVMKIQNHGVPIASLHTDHVAGDNTRLINYRYAQNQLQPLADSRVHLPPDGAH